MNDKQQELFFEGLHPEQRKGMAALLRTIEENHQKIYFEAPTRYGKWVIAWKMLSGMQRLGVLDELGRPILITTDTRNNRMQCLEEAEKHGGSAAALAEEITSTKQALESGSRILVMSKHLAHMVDKASIEAGGPRFLRRFGLIINDEGDLDLSDARQEAFDSLTNEDANLRIIAFTATSAYSKAKSLKAAGYVEAYSLLIPDAVAVGVIAQIHNVLVEVEGVTESLDTVPLSGADFDENAIEDYLDRAEFYVKAAHLFVERARVQIAQGKPPSVSMGFCGGIKSSCVAAEIFNRTWREAMPDYKNAAHQKFWRDMPEDVRAYLKDYVSDNAIAVPFWGAMPDRVKDYLVEGHRSGALPMQTSDDVHIRGYTNMRVVDIYNMVPTLSPNRAGQRAGRALGLDSDWLEKMATIFDFVFPSENRIPCMYAHFAGGFLFERSQANVQKDHTSSPNFELSQLRIPGLRIISDVGQMVSFLRDAQLAAEARRVLSDFPLHIAKRMVAKGLLSQKAILDLARKKLDEERMRDDRYWSGALAQPHNPIMATLRGELPALGDHGYTPAAILAATVLGSTPDKLFKVLPPANVPRRKTEHMEKRARRQFIESVNFAAHDWEDGAYPDPELWPAFDAARGETISVDDPRVRWDEIDALQVPSAEDVVEQSQLRSMVTQILLKLPAKTERVLRLRMQDDEKTQDEIGAQFDLSRTRIGQLVDRALRTLKMNDRSNMGSNGFSRVYNLEEHEEWRREVKHAKKAVPVLHGSPITDDPDFNNLFRILIILRKFARVANDDEAIKKVSDEVQKSPNLSETDKQFSTHVQAEMLRVPEIAEAYVSVMFAMAVIKMNELPSMQGRLLDGKKLWDSLIDDEGKISTSFRHEDVLRTEIGGASKIRPPMPQKLKPVLLHFLY